MLNAVDAVVSMHGKLDIMYSNAGIAGERFEFWILSIDPQVFRKVFDVNVYGSFLAAKHVARVMVPKCSGTILFTGSAVTASYGLAPHNYTASKHAVVGLTKNLCVELGQFGIRVNCISPYAVMTPMAAEFAGCDEEAYKKRVLPDHLKLMRAEEVAEVALNMVSDESKYICGLNLLVDGGVCLKSA
ncbi:unnamed protein product [Linum tenue]|nr:unnamed protein product [Linum tenue]